MLRSSPPTAQSATTCRSQSGTDVQSRHVWPVNLLGSNDMRVAILIFEKLTALDAIGPYEVLRSVPGWEVKFVGPEKGFVRTDSGHLGLSVDHLLEEVTEPDIVLVGGGEGNRALLEDEAVLSWLREVDAHTKWTTSVCT